MPPGIDKHLVEDVVSTENNGKSETLNVILNRIYTVPNNDELKNDVPKKSLSDPKGKLFFISCFTAADIAQSFSSSCSINVHFCNR